MSAILISKILIVGLGSIGLRHLRLARQQFPDAQIMIQRHQKFSVIPEFADGCFFTVEQAMKFSPQIAIISGPASHHIHIARHLAEIGVHLLIEKPLSISLAGVMDLIETCQKNKLVLMTGYNLRFLPSLRRLRDALEAEILGEVLSVRCEVGQYLPTWRADNDYRKSVSARKDLGGGALSELSHEIDYLRWLFGEIEWVKATLSKQSNLEIDVEDSAHLTLSFLSKSGNSKLLATLNLDMIRHDNTRFCIVIGEKGTLSWNGITGELNLFEAGASSWTRLYANQEQIEKTYFEEWKEFISCVYTQKRPLITGEDGLRVIEIMEAARLSSKSGSREIVIRAAYIDKQSK